jgi:Ribbon-helix-helix protein, copG family
MHVMKEDQLTLRVPASLSRVLAARARERDVPKSQIIREALERYLAEPPAEHPSAVWERVASYVGSVSLDRAASERDALAAQLRAHNWRE